jgi:transposase
MARTAHPIHLSDDELHHLTTLLRRGTTPARTATRARILDLLHRGTHPASIAATLGVSVATVFNVKRRYVADDLDAALIDRPRSGKPVQIDGITRAKITALACSAAPDGHARWTLRLLADKVVELRFADQLSHTTVRKILKKTTCNRTASASGASGRLRRTIWRGWKMCSPSTTSPTIPSAQSCVLTNSRCSSSRM